MSQERRSAATRATAAVELRGITKRFPGVVANRDVDLRVRARHDPRHRRRERRRQVDPDEDPLRDAAARRGHDLRRRARGRLLSPAATPSPPASAWSTSTSCWPTTSPSWRTSCSAPSSSHGDRSTRRGPQPHPRARRRATASASTPTQLVEDLGVGERQRVEILKVLYRGARILILDEPTAVLVPQEVDELFAQPARAQAARA